jgi:hypothetical protein
VVARHEKRGGQPIALDVVLIVVEFHSVGQLSTLRNILANSYFRY